MTEMLQSVVESLVSQGPLGGIVVLLVLWIWRIQRRLDSVQEMRVADAFRIVEVAAAATAALERNTQTLNSLTESE